MTHTELMSKAYITKMILRVLKCHNVDLRSQMNIF